MPTAKMVDCRCIYLVNSLNSRTCRSSGRRLLEISPRSTATAAACTASQCIAKFVQVVAVIGPPITCSLREDMPFNLFIESQL